jgi:hypothetical protein
LRGLSYKIAFRENASTGIIRWHRKAKLKAPGARLA